MHTRTGSFPIGFRRGWSQWQKDLPALCSWAKSADFQSLDLNVATAADMSTVTNAGLAIGSVDLLSLGDITHPDAGKRKEIVDRNISYITEAAGWGAKVFFTIVGGDPARKRSENYKTAVEAFAPIAETAAAAGVTIAVEGYPGGAPNLALLCTTPETVRAFLKDIPRGLSINYDPSHLIRLGVDHIRFLNEFGSHVSHVHGKDTELFPEAGVRIRPPSAERLQGRSRLRRAGLAIHAARSRRRAVDRNLQDAAILRLQRSRRHRT